MRAFAPFQHRAISDVVRYERFRGAGVPPGHPGYGASSPQSRKPAWTAAFRPVGGQESAVKASGLVPQPPSTSAACDQQAELAQVAVISPLAAENVDAALLHAPQLGARHLGHGTRNVELARVGRYAHVRRVAGIGYVADAHADADTTSTANIGAKPRVDTACSTSIGAEPGVDAARISDIDAGPAFAPLLPPTGAPSYSALAWGAAPTTGR